MGYSIGPKIGIDGEAEFRRQIKDINTEYKALEAETRALTAAFNANGDEQGKLRGTSNQLEKQIDAQKRKMKLLEDAVQKASDKYGANSVEATRLRGALYDTQATVSTLENELKDVNRQLEQTSEGMEEFEDSTEEAGNAALDFKDIVGANFISDVAVDLLHEAADAAIEFAKGMPEAAAEVNAANSQFEQTFGDMESTAKSALQSISDDTKIAVTRMQGDYTKLFAFTKSVGGDSEQAMDIASRAMKAAADNAAYYDKSIEEATEQLQSFIKGNYENDAALGIAATETSRNAKANELYATSFDKLSEAQKVDVLLAMVEAGNAASGALGQAAREADSWTNVQGELDEAMKQFQATLGQPVLAAVIPIIQGITASINELIEKADWQVLDDGINEFTSSMESAESRFQTTSAEIETSALMAEHYVKRLEELEAAGLETEESQREYANTVEHLNALYPELNLLIDDNTGLVYKNTDMILTHINAMKQKALYAAMEEKYTAALKAQADATLAVREAEYARTGLQAQIQVLQDQLTNSTGMTVEQLIRQYNYQMMANSAMGSGMYSAAGQAAALAMLGESVIALTPAQKEMLSQLIQLQGEESLLNAKIEEGENTISSYDTELNDLMVTLGDFTVTTTTATESQDDLSSGVQMVEEKITELQKTYDAAKTSAENSIRSQIGLFDELAMESKTSTADIIANWKTQQLAFSNYATNLKKAVDMGLDQSLINQLSDGSNESMLILNEFVNDTEISIDDINTAFRDRMQAEDLVTSAMAEARTGANSEMAALIEDSKGWGKYIVDGAVSGINANAHRFYGAMGGLGAGGERAFRQTWEINSPSRVMEKDNKYIVDAAVLTVKGNIDEYETAMREFGSAGYMAYLDARIAAAEAYPSLMDATVNYTTNSAAPVNYGGFNIHIYQQPGEDATDLAHRIMDVMQMEIANKEVSIGAYS